MSEKKKKKSGMHSTNATVADNRRARFDYHIEETFDAGIQLVGSEVKSLRLGRCSINEAHIAPKGSEIYAYNIRIAEYTQAAAHLQHEPSRPKRLLLKKHEINKLIGSVTRKGMTIVPVKLYFNDRGLAKMIIGLAKGKKMHDKREDIKKREWGRQKQRLLKQDTGHE